MWITNFPTNLSLKMGLQNGSFDFGFKLMSKTIHF